MPTPAPSISSRQAARGKQWSVMIPCYNPDQNYLAQTLNAVLAQDLGGDAMQIEVIDDCSPNGAPSDLIRGLCGDRVSIHREPKNLGLAGIWNRCIERAEGEWIHILHQDDLVYPGFYSSLAKGLSDSTVGAAFTRHAYCDNEGHWQTLSPLEAPRAGILRDFLGPLVTGPHVTCASIVVKRSTYERVGGFLPALKHALDWEMWIRIAKEFDFYYEPQILAAWRVHSNATTSRQIRSGENIRDIIQAIRIWRDYLPSDIGAAWEKRALKRFAGEAFWMSRECLTKGDLHAFRNQLAAGLACDRSLATLSSASRLIVKAILLRFGRAGHSNPYPEQKSLSS